MKKVIALTLVFIFVLSLSAFAEEETMKIGQLFISGRSEEKLSSESRGIVNEDRDFIYFDSLTSLIMALNSGRIDGASLPYCVSQYVVAHNENYEAVERHSTIEFQLGVLEENTALLEQLNTAIAKLSADGTLDALAGTYFVPDAEPEPAEMPVIEGAETVRVVVTGDLPPLDYTTAEGKPAGFNVALLAALSAEMNVNIELVLSDAGSRAAMLTSGRAEAVFWMRKFNFRNESGEVVYSDVENPDGIAVSDAYCEVKSSSLMCR